MYSNLKDEFKSDVIIFVQNRTVTQQSNTIDFSTLGQQHKKAKRVWFTIVTGTVTDMTHNVRFFTGNNAGNLTEIPGSAVPIAAGENNIVRFQTLSRPKKFLRVDHVVSGAVAAGGAVGVIMQVPVDPTFQNNSAINIEEVLRHCVFALGEGAGTKIRRDAIEAVCDHVREGFDKELHRPQDQGIPGDTGPGLDRWNTVSAFLLDSSYAIGQLAAAKARDEGVLKISKRHIKAAYDLVRANAPNDAGVGGAGDYCPDGLDL